MIQIHICEDSSHQLKQLEKALRYACAVVSEEMEVVTLSTRPEEILEIVAVNDEINIYFLDIDLNHKNINGLDLAVKIREKDPVAYICFVTTHPEMSYLTFKYKVMAIDFIIKDTYDSLINDFVRCLDSINKLVNLQQENGEKYIKLDLFHEQKMVALESVIAVETIGNHKIRMYTDTQTIDMSRTLSNIKKELPDNFVKCHRAFIVNMNKISSFDAASGKLVLSNKMELYAATRKIKDIKEIMKKKSEKESLLMR